jgi:hypothetical protein
MEYGIRILKKVFSGPEVDDMPELESNIFLLIAHTIWMDYGKLVSEEEITGIELIKWAYRKKLYQQTLTIIESKIPLEFVQKGILYYAIDEETRLHMLESLQLCYETAILPRGGALRIRTIISLSFMEDHMSDPLLLPRTGRGTMLRSGSGSCLKIMKTW